MKRKVLVILSNRWSRTQKPRFVELSCDEKGNILKERSLRAKPGKPVYDEVWESDEGKTVLSSAYRLKRKYGHPLQRRKA